MLFRFSNSQSNLISQLDKENPFEHAVDGMEYETNAIIIIVMTLKFLDGS